MSASQPKRASPPPRVRVSIGTTPAERKDFVFTESFRIGRGDDCGVCIKDDFVSRNHVEVSFENGQWWIRDMGSANGIFVKSERIKAVPVTRTLAVRLGVEGPFVGFAVETAPEAPVPAQSQPNNEAMMAQYVQHYFGEGVEGQPAGERTMMVRRAFQQVQTKQKRKHWGIVGGLTVLLLGVGGYAYYEHRQNQKQKSMAQDLFYAMKSLDVDIGTVEKLVLASNNAQARDQVKKYQSRRRQMEKSYEQFLTSLHVYDTKMSEQDKLVLRMARVFGECELAMPPGFVSEVQSYIKKWQSSGRFARAVRLAEEKGYTTRITDEFLGQNLPPQFFYLAMQESDFDAYISGPPTRKGIAKGMWQFIPETGIKYGLRVGPLADFRRPDPADDRHHWEKATGAAARYIKDIYTTDAQASGLLVMASYNWGEDKVIRLIQSMPPNPRDRNFWQLLAKYRNQIPEETYNYVYYIFSAAVIGENPRLFGFPFDNPLGHLETK
jgi:hypothetical protein